MAVASYHHVPLHHEQSRDDKTGVIAALSILAGHLGHDNSQHKTKHWLRWKGLLKIHNWNVGKEICRHPEMAEIESLDA